MSDIVYAVLHIPTGEYVTLKHRNSITALFDDTVAANKMISIMVKDTSFYWGAPRIDYEIGKSSLSTYTIPPSYEEFDIVAIPKHLLNKEALAHVLTVQLYHLSYA